MKLPFFTISDEQAMWRVQMQDDSAAFAQLFHRWRGPIHRLCVRMLGDEQRAEDLTQEAFARVYADSEFELTGGGPLPDREAAEGDDAQFVRLALAQLPEHYRVVVVLRHYEDLKFREIAEVLGIPEGTVKSRMTEALSILGSVLKKSLGAEPRGEPKELLAL